MGKTECTLSRKWGDRVSYWWELNWNPGSIKLWTTTYTSSYIFSHLSQPERYLAFTKINQKKGQIFYWKFVTSKINAATSYFYILGYFLLLLRAIPWNQLDTLSTEGERCHFHSWISFPRGLSLWVKNMKMRYVLTFSATRDKLHSCW